ncbi:peptidoglycan -binding protein [Aestuariispira insulae]|uniref:Chemotaxis protein MotB n=1 Tax=Aestuariispira insulae TaxID=1461337 RepID=A0A3D9HJW8_9PROT|nr:peptidoglycan -binding protein [Aestuariispira insulae]RED49763.1 chemotaxis protein MotB [Aestuariispira insulae]
MALARRNRNNQDIWPGFVDALATLLMVVIFLLMIFVISQLYLNEALVGRDKALDKLNLQVSELAEMLQLERSSNADLRSNVERLSTDLRASLAKQDSLENQLASLRGEKASLAANLDEEESELEKLRADYATRTDELNKVRAELEDAYKVVEASKEKIELQLGQLADLNHQLEALQALKEQMQAELIETQSANANQEKKLVEANDELLAAQAEAALLNKQLKELGSQLAELNALLDASEAKDEESQATIKALGQRLNAALASKVQELSRYRSEFFGRLRQLLGNRQGIQIVNDRFVFQSEVLFSSGSADLGLSGQEQLGQLAATLKEIAADIPPEIEWILQVEGHTDNVPIASARFPSNWELSAARAISVVKFLISQGIPAENLSAAGYGEFQPLDPRNDEIAHRRNRRIELKLTQR